MARKIKYYLVAAEALPEIFIRVAEAKRMMQTGEADTVGAATKMAGISRSAFYKYKDAIYLYDERMSENITTLYLTLEVGAYHYVLHPAEGCVRYAFQRSGRVCRLRRQHPDHQPEHSHKRLRGRDHFR